MIDLVSQQRQLSFDWLFTVVCRSMSPIYRFPPTGNSSHWPIRLHAQQFQTPLVTYKTKGKICVKRMERRHSHCFVHENAKGKAQWIDFAIKPNCLWRMTVWCFSCAITECSVWAASVCPAWRTARLTTAASGRYGIIIFQFIAVILCFVHSTTTKAISESENR